MESRAATIQIWNHATGQRVGEVPEPGRVAALSPDGRLIAVGLAQSNIRLRELTSDRVWAADHNAPVSTHVLNSFIPGDTPAVYGSGLTPDGRFFFALRTNGLARVWNATTGQMTWHSRRQAIGSR